MSARTDAYGFHLKNEAQAAYNETVKQYETVGDLSGLTEYKRKMPSDVRDAFSLNADCVLYPHLLSEQKNHILIVMQSPAIYADHHLPQRGDLEWMDGFMSSVVFIPNENGVFTISQFPKVANHINTHAGRWRPLAVGDYVMGVDPIDHGKGKGSRFAFVIKRRWNSVDDMDNLSADGNPIDIYKMRTNRYVLSYAQRPDNPNTNYECALKAAVFYGCQMFIERDKPGLINYLIENNLDYFLMYKPKNLAITQTTANPGMKTTAEVIENFVPRLKLYVFDYYKAIMHLDIIGDFASFTGDNLGKCDLVAACGYAEMAAGGIYAKGQSRNQQRSIKSIF